MGRENSIDRENQKGPKQRQVLARVSLRLFGYDKVKVQDITEKGQFCRQRNGTSLCYIEISRNIFVRAVAVQQKFLSS